MDFMIGVALAEFGWHKTPYRGVEDTYLVFGRKMGRI
jgi:hypothetical protein